MSSIVIVTTPVTVPYYVRDLSQAIRAAGIDVELFLTVGVSAALRQLLEFGLFHGDPHPGNIFAMRDGRIAYVDFGNVAELSQVHSRRGQGSMHQEC